MSVSTTDELEAQIVSQVKALGLPERECKAFIGRVVSRAWPSLPNFSTLSAPIISEVQQATVGTGIVPVFKENGVYKALVMKAGTHYKSDRPGGYAADPSVPTYMIAGGFINLTETPGSSEVAANPKKGESPREGAVRELEEELVDDKGNPILKIKPERLIPMDTKTLTFEGTGERRVVIGMMLELTPPEIAVVRAHVNRLEEEPEYRRAVRAHTKNKDSGEPEVCTASILPLNEIVDEKHKLLYPDQMSLFHLVNERCTGSAIGR